MSDESSAEIKAARTDFMLTHRARYLETGGASGHIEDLRAVGGYQLGTHLLIKYRGRKSGRRLITPLCYTRFGSELVIIGSKGGADHHPNWYLNLIAQPEIDFQVATQAYHGRWREPVGEEREAAWQRMVTDYPFYADYQASTERVLPVILLQPESEISVFTHDDADAERPL